VTEGTRIAARSGLGAVMGSKNLKAVALSGKTRIEPHDSKAVAALTREFSRWVKEGDRTAKWLPSGLTRPIARLMRLSPFGFGASGEMTRMFLRAYGTIVSNVISAETGDSPVKNWKGVGASDFPMATHSGKLDPGRIIAHQRERYHCSSCPLGCGGILDLRGKTRFGLAETHKPEYETCSAFGSLILNNDLDALFYLNDLLNRAGMDTIGAGGAVAFALECYEQGLLSREECDGLELTWGNTAATVALVEKMVRREGIGELLADGSKRAAERLGRGAELAMHAGGQDLPMHDPRLDPGFGVAYAMEPTPGRHTNFSYLYLESFALHKIFPGLPAVDMVYRKSSRLQAGERDEVLAAAAKYSQVMNGAGACLLGILCGPRYPLLAFLRAATGWERAPDDWLAAGERIEHLRQAFNLKHGRRPGVHFRLPARVRGEPPLGAGPLKGARVPLEELNRGYARRMGWDESGRPLSPRLRELGLGSVADDLDALEGSGSRGEEGR
jgi:aldehyde:ferredoxin oxidoreductase